MDADYDEDYEAWLDQLEQEQQRQRIEDTQQEQ